eukprot:351548-Chlamydomonas_euryale.AAC.9
MGHPMTHIHTLWDVLLHICYTYATHDMWHIQVVSTPCEPPTALNPTEGKTAMHAGAPGEWPMASNETAVVHTLAGAAREC